MYSHPGVIDFSANLNPLGIPRAVVDALREKASGFDIYPDTRCRELCCAIAAHDKVPQESILCTAGATDLIIRICQTLMPRCALVMAPGFSGYEQALEQVGSVIVRHYMRAKDGFALTKRALSCIDPSVNLIFLCSPNNPTGLSINPELLVRILDKARQNGAIVVLDECFQPFTRSASATLLVPKYPNLIVMRAFTKFYAMAGLRLGYGVSSDVELLKKLACVSDPWAVSTPAQVAGVTALSVKDWAVRTRKTVDYLRANLQAGLERLGLSVVNGEANFLLFHSPLSLYAPLLERGFLIRRCENYHGLDKNWYRVAVRKEQENAALLKAIHDVVR